MLTERQATNERDYIYVQTVNQQLKHCHIVPFIWVPCHSAVQGNENANELARKEEKALSIHNSAMVRLLKVEVEEAKEPGVNCKVVDKRKSS